MKSLRVAYWDQSPRHLSSWKDLLERYLRQITEIKCIDVKSLDQAAREQVDLTIVHAEHLDREAFHQWLSGLMKTARNSQAIWIPTLIVTRMNFADVRPLFSPTYEENWYCDLIHPDHIDSLPLRVVNLIKIHDHLKELKRYRVSLENLEKQTQALNEQLDTLRQADSE